MQESYGRLHTYENVVYNNLAALGLCLARLGSQDVVNGRFRICPSVLQGGSVKLKCKVKLAIIPEDGYNRQRFSRSGHQQQETPGLLLIYHSDVMSVPSGPTGEGVNKIGSVGIAKCCCAHYDLDLCVAE